MLNLSGVDFDAFSARSPEHRTAIFIDLDGTMLHQQSTLTLMKAMCKRWPMRERYLRPVLKAEQRYMEYRTYDYRPVAAALVEAIAPMFAGLRAKEVDHIAEGVARASGATYLFPRTLMATIRGMSPHMRTLVVAVTGSPEPFARVFCASNGIDLLHATVPEIQDGCYTGRFNERSVHAKGEVVQEVMERLALAPGNCLSIGDTMSDVPMFERTRYTVACNPNVELLAWARAHRGTVLVQDGQKQGVLFFQSNGKLFIESSSHRCLPSWLLPLALPDAYPVALSGATLSSQPT